MAIATLSEKFAEEADSLPKDAKSKLVKTLRLLTSNPRHPSLQFKKIQGSVRTDVYECRVDRFWRLIVRLRDGPTIDLIHVGPHDEAIRMGAESEALPPWLAGFLAVRNYLAGDDRALAFTDWDSSDLMRTIAAMPEEA